MLYSYEKANAITEYGYSIIDKQVLIVEGTDDTISRIPCTVLVTVVQKKWIQMGTVG